MLTKLTCHMTSSCCMVQLYAQQDACANCAITQRIVVRKLCIGAAPVADRNASRVCRLRVPYTHTVFCSIECNTDLAGLCSSCLHHVWQSISTGLRHTGRSQRHSAGCHLLWHSGSASCKPGIEGHSADNFRWATVVNVHLNMPVPV